MAKGTMIMCALCLVSVDGRLAHKGKTRTSVKITYMSCIIFYLSLSWNFGHFHEYRSLVPLPPPLSCQGWTPSARFNVGLRQALIRTYVALL